MSDDHDGCEWMSFFWYRPTRVVLDQRPSNSCVCVVWNCTEHKPSEMLQFALQLVCHIMLQLLLRVWLPITTFIVLLWPVTVERPQKTQLHQHLWRQSLTLGQLKMLKSYRVSHFSSSTIHMILATFEVLQYQYISISVQFPLFGVVSKYTLLMLICLLLWLHISWDIQMLT